MDDSPSLDTPNTTCMHIQELVNAMYCTHTIVQHTSMSAAMSARLMTGHFSALMRADQEGGGEGLLTQCCNMAWNPASADGWSRSMTWT